jgi:predicted CopG family antitoxin
MKVIKINDEAYWALKDKKLELEKIENHRVTYGEVILSLIRGE